MSSKIGQFFNPAEHLVFHQDKEGNMIGGGYQVNNLLYQQKRPLFVSLEEQSGGGGGGGNGGSVGGGHEQHFIPQKFSDLFRDLAVPAGLFMMPPMFRPRNYAFEVPEEEESSSSDSSGDEDDEDDDDRHVHKKKDYKSTKHAPNDIFDTLLSLVESKERIQHDVKTRRRQRRSNEGNDRKETKRPNKTRRRKESITD
jgi:hypothetical protein